MTGFSEVHDKRLLINVNQLFFFVGSPCRCAGGDCSSGGVHHVRRLV